MYMIDATKGQKSGAMGNRVFFKGRGGGGGLPSFVISLVSKVYKTKETVQEE
jgi:hypothetical protein